jgi:hypothetical protein
MVAAGFADIVGRRFGKTHKVRVCERERSRTSLWTIRRLRLDSEPVSPTGGAFTEAVDRSRETEGVPAAKPHAATFPLTSAGGH